MADSPGKPGLISSGIKSFAVANPLFTIGLVLAIIIVIVLVIKNVSNDISGEISFQKDLERASVEAGIPNSSECPEGSLPVDPKGLVSDLIRAFNYKNSFFETSDNTLIVQCAKRLRKSQEHCFEIFFNSHMRTKENRPDLTYQACIRSGWWEGQYELYVDNIIKD